MTTKTFSMRRLADFFAPPAEPVGPEGASAPTRGAVRSAAWLTEDTLLLAARSDAGEAPAASGVRSLTCGDDLRLFVVPGLADDLGGFERRMGPAARTLPADAVADALVDVTTLVRDHLAGLTPALREEVRAFLATTLLASSDDPTLAETLHRIREALRERLPNGEIRSDEPRGVHLDHLVAVDDRSFYVKGWLWEGTTSALRLTAETPEGCRVDLLDRRATYSRPDIATFYGDTSGEKHRAGFVCFFRTPAPSYLPEGWLVELEGTDGDAVQKKAPPVVQDVLAARTTILEDIALRDHMPDDFIEHHLYPALSRLQERHEQTVAVDRVEQYGTPPPDPDVSVIVPLYKRIDFLEQQLAQFALDEDLFTADLLYVLDSPEQADELHACALQLYRLYRIPFRVVVLNRNGGFSAVNNLGASLARGRLLLLLNSDVLPDRPGWLGTLAARYDATPQAGALGPKLLYEDDSLQHAGLYFLRSEGDAEWENMHYYKGLHRRLPAANVARAVPAVTAACLMIGKDRYQEVGGLQGRYVQGDYEDSDLCLRLVEAGYENWYDPEVELYHLEGQSYPGSLRRKAQQYNRWLHTRLWNKQIEAVMAASYPPVIRMSSSY